MSDLNEGMDPADGKKWGQSDYPPKGFHLVDIISIESHPNFKKTDTVWDIQVECPDVGGGCLDKAGRAKASQACAAAGYPEGEMVFKEDLEGEQLVCEFGDAKGANTNKLFRSVLGYYPADHEVTPEDEIDWAPPPREEAAEKGSTRKPRTSSRAQDNGDEEEEDKPKRSKRSAGRARSGKGSKVPPPA